MGYSNGCTGGMALRPAVDWPDTVTGGGEFLLIVPGAAGAPAP